MASKTKAKAKGRSESPAQGEKTASTPSRSTAPDRVSEQKLRRARLGRRILLGAMIAFVGLGLAGVLGQRTATVTARSNGYELAVTYGSVVRPGVPIRWNVNVHRDGGFQGPIDVEVSRHYFDLFDTNMGRRELSEMSAFELVLLVVMGDLIQQGVAQQDNSVVGAMLAVSTFALWTLAFSYATYRWNRVQPIIEGVPAVVVQDGRPLTKVLDYERLTRPPCSTPLANRASPTSRTSGLPCWRPTGSSRSSSATRAGRWSPRSTSSSRPTELP